MWHVAVLLPTSDVRDKREICRVNSFISFAIFHAIFAKPKAKRKGPKLAGFHPTPVPVV
jgi:hypothetical protein